MPNNLIKSITSNMLNNFYSTFKYNQEYKYFFYNLLRAQQPLYNRFPIVKMITIDVWH